MRVLIAAIVLLPFTAMSQDQYYMDFNLRASEIVSQTPVLYFETLDKARFEVPVSGEVPGNTFPGRLTMPRAKAQTGNFSLVEGTLSDLAGNIGTVLEGAHLEVENPLLLDLYVDGRGGYPEMLRMKASTSVLAVTPVQIGDITTRWGWVQYWYAPNPARPKELVRINLVMGNDKGTLLRWSAILPYMQPTDFEIRIPRNTFREASGWVNNNLMFKVRRELFLDDSP